MEDQAAPYNRNLEIKDYICRIFVKEDKDLLDVKGRSLKKGVRHIAVPENVGKLLYLFAKLQKPQRILELGTLAGYSTLWLSKGAPEAQIITIECEPRHVAIARENFKRSKKEDRITVMEGEALDILKRFKEEGEPPFDLIFLDADKINYPQYLPYLLDLSRPGTLLLTDNLIPKEGHINSPNINDLVAICTYQYNTALASNPTIDTTLITTIVGDKGRIDALGVSIL